MGEDTPGGRTLGATEARVGSALFLGGSAVIVISILAPHARGADVAGFWALALVTALIGIALRIGAERVPAWGFQAIMVLASAMVGLALCFSAERHGGPASLNEVFYLWVGLYAGYFFTRRAIVAQIVVAAATYAAALVVIHPGAIAFTRWFVIVAVVTVAASLVHALKHRNALLVASLTRAARSDWLTGLLNRQGYEERFELEFERARRTGQPLAIVLGDLDGLKAVNDLLGHAAGDTALVAVGGLLDDARRKLDTAARIGGDEFALLLPSTDADGGFEFAERLRERLSTLTGSCQAPLTMSFGIVEYPRHGATRETLMHAADQALYRAKQQGRDRSVIDPLWHEPIARS
jgi:diguanylate cyclase (GGDEF)-like protein